LTSSGSGDDDGTSSSFSSTSSFFFCLLSLLSLVTAVDEATEEGEAVETLLLCLVATAFGFDGITVVVVDVVLAADGHLETSMMTSLFLVPFAGSMGDRDSIFDFSNLVVCLLGEEVAMFYV